jgi:hypothetical protein
MRAVDVMTTEVITVGHNFAGHWSRARRPAPLPWQSRGALIVAVTIPLAWL